MAETGQVAELFGIPLPQIVGFFLTVVASFFSARFGSLETKRQFDKKAQDEFRAAAAELIPPLMKFAVDCQYRWMTLRGSSTQDPYAGTEPVDFPNGIYAAAAKLGPLATEQTIKLELTKQMANSRLDYERSERTGYVKDHIKTAAYFALLALRARLLVDVASEQAGMRMRHDDFLLAPLRKDANDFIPELQLSDESKWS